MEMVLQGSSSMACRPGPTTPPAQEQESQAELRRGPWTVDEDLTLVNYIAEHGEGRWNALARAAGLKRTGKSCRLRWLNYRRPDVKRGNFTAEEQLLILDLHSRWGNSLSEGAPLNSSGYGEERRDSNMYALRAGDGGSSSTGTQVPHLWLDSGATHHFVGDDRILTNLRDLPAGMVVTVANGSQLPVTKVGDIQTPDIEITNVYFVPGFEMHLISVHQLAKSKIFTTFYEKHAELWLEGTRIGRAIIDDDGALLYRLCSLQAPCLKEGGIGIRVGSSTMHMPEHCSLSEGALLNSSGYGEERRDSNMYALRAGDRGSSPTGTQVPHLWLDSGATHHFVGDDRILTNLRDLHAGMVVTVANGTQLPVTKVGDIQIQIQTTDTPDIEIKDVNLVPGLTMCLVSVRQLAKSKIVTTFYENCAKLRLEGRRIGGAIIDDAALLYRMRYLWPLEAKLS